MPARSLTEPEGLGGGRCLDDHALTVTVQTAVQVPDKPGSRRTNKYKLTNTKRRIAH